MTEDIAPALLEAIRADFAEELAKIAADATTWPEAYDYAAAVGKELAKVLRRHLSSDVLPDGRLYWNIADRVLRPMLEQDHGLIAGVAAQVQQGLNEAAGLGLKAMPAELDADRVDGILNVAANAEEYDTVAGQVGSAVENFSMHTVDETIRRNVEFQGGAGLKPRVIRKAAFGCCPWCTALAGTYTYPGVPKDVWRRHENCNCTVEYDPGDGRRQNVYTKRWSSTDSTEQRKTVQQNLQKAALQKEEKSATIQKRQESTAQAEAQKEFRTKALLDRHFSKHQLEYGTISEGKYLQIANEIASEPLSDDVVQLERSDGSISKYRYSTNDFLVVNKDGTIRTLFKPEKGGEYWQNELDRN